METLAYLAIIAIVAIAVAMQPRAYKTKRPTLEDFSIPRANQGDPIPMVFGVVTITGPTVVWYGDLLVQTETEDGVKTRTFFMGLHFILCHGPIDYLYAIYAGERQAWAGSVTASTTITISAGSLFGGKRQAGGIAGDVDVMFGEASQTANAYLTTAQGTPQPAYRGVVSLVANQVQVSANQTHIEPWSFRVERILEGWYGGTAWYPETARIGEQNWVYPYDSYLATLSVTNRWRLGEALDGTSSPTEANLGSNTATLAIGVSQTADLAAAVVSGTDSPGAVRLDGTQAYGANNTPISGAGSSFTVVAWIQLDPGDAGGWFFRSHLDTQYAHYSGLSVGAFVDTGNTYIRVRIGNDQSGYTGDNHATFLTTANPFATSAAVCITVVVNAQTPSRTTEIIVYVDGAEIGRKAPYLSRGNTAAEIALDLGDGVQGALTYEGGFCNTAVWPIGGNGGQIGIGTGYNDAFDGLIDDVTAHNAALSDEEIALIDYYGRLDRYAVSVVGMNPAHIIYQAITEPMGMGLPSSLIDDTSFRAAADVFFEEGMGLSLQWTQQEAVRDFIQHICDHAACVLRISPRTGKFELKPIRADYDINALDVYDETLISEIELFERAGYGELVGEVTIKYRDAATNTDAAVTMQNLAVIQAQSGVVGETIDLPGLPLEALAQRVCLRELKSRSVPLARVKFKVLRSAWELLPGDVFVLTWAKLGLSAVAMRVAGIDTGTLTDGLITVEAVEDVFGMPSSTYAASQQSGWTDPAISDPDATGEAARLWEDGTTRRQHDNIIRVTG